jgi:hypothetical protein
VADAGTAAAQPPLDAAAAAAAAAAAEEEAAVATKVRSDLLEGFQLFQEQRTQRQLFLEVDAAARLGQYALCGRQVRVLWPDDEAWYLGTISSYDSVSGEHTVSCARRAALPLD